MSTANSADRLLFPAAAGFALLAVPVWVLTLGGQLAAPGPYWHAHEMLFGYAFAVVAGYLLARVSPRLLVALFGAWLAARIAPWWFGQDSLWTALPNLVYAVLVAALTAPPFLRAAKKVQNLSFGPLLIAMAVCEAVFQIALLTGRDDIALGALRSGVDLFTLLLLLMGGRVIAPAVAGHFHRRGRLLAARVQPRLELAVLLLMLGVIVLDLIPAARPAAGALALVAAAVTAVRATRWRLWEVLDDPALWTLGLGYAWLVIGLALKGWSQWLGGPGGADVVHGITVGALGTTTLVMMARTRVQRRRERIECFGDIGLAALLMTGAALLRLVPALAGVAMSSGWLWGAAIAWMAAYALLLRRLLALRGAGGADAGPGG